MISNKIFFKEKTYLFVALNTEIKLLPFMRKELLIKKLFIIFVFIENSFNCRKNKSKNITLFKWIFHKKQSNFHLINQIIQRNPLSIRTAKRLFKDISSFHSTYRYRCLIALHSLLLEWITLFLGPCDLSYLKNAHPFYSLSQEILSLYILIIIWGTNSYLFFSL